MPGTRQKKVVFINHWAKDLGGAEISLLDLLEAAAMRADVTLVTSEDGELTLRAAAMGVRCNVIAMKHSLRSVTRTGLLIESVQHWRAILSFFKFLRDVGRVIACTNPAIIHANVPKSHITLFVLKLFGYQGVGILHMREIFSRHSLPRLLYAWLFSLAPMSVIAISQAVKESLPRAMSVRAKVLYNGVPVTAPLFEGTNREDCPPRFLYVGRVVPWKGCHLLVASFAEAVLHYGPQAGTLSIVGGTLYADLAYRKSLEAVIQSRGIGAMCRLFDHTPQPIEVMRRHDVFCIASLHEPFGRVVAEAQGCGLPVIAFDGGGTGEIIVHEKTGFIVPSGSPKELTKAMERFIEDPALIARFGAAAYNRAAQLFDREKNTTVLTDAILGETIATADPRLGPGTE